MELRSWKIRKIENSEIQMRMQLANVFVTGIQIFSKRQ